MITRWGGLLGFAFVFGVTASASAHPHHCAQHQFEGVNLKYCIDTGSPANPDLLYIFHGSDGTAEDWIKAIDNVHIQQVWDREGIHSPTKITISFGNEWDFNDTDTPENPSLQRIFVTEIIPYIESKIPGPHGRRLFKGVSMGGWNGVQLLLKNSELFERMALICPVISTISPYSSQSDIDAFLNRPFIKKDWVNDLLNDERKMFPTLADWNRHDPLVLIKSARFHTHNVYLSCGHEDDYGFFQGTEMFAQQAFGRGADITWQPMHGGHCTIDAESVAHFFTDKNI